MHRKIALFVLSIIVIAAPIIVSATLIYAKFSISLTNFAPFWNDELWHWHQAATFAEVGFNGGYYTFDEKIPFFDFSHYYSWGVWLYVYYGSIARLVDYNLASFMFINIGTFMAATTLFILLVRPSFEKLLLLGAVLATFVPLIQYIPSNMPLVLQLSISLLIAGAFYHLLTRQVSTRFVISATILLMLAGLSRPTFTVFLFPLYVLASKQRNWKTILRAIAVSVPLTLMSAAAFYLSAAPFPHFRTLLFLDAGTMGEKIQSIIEYLRLSSIWLTTHGDTVTFAMRYQILLLLAMLLGWGGFLLWQLRQGQRKAQATKPILWEIVFHLFNLLGFYALTILFHEALDGHDYRVMAPHLFISLILLVAMRRRTLVLVMVLASLAAFPALWTLLTVKDPNYNGIAQTQFSHWQPILADTLVYDPDVPNAWCNTLSVSEYYTRPFGGEAGLMLATPPGIGISWLFNWEGSERFSVPEDLKARYLMLHRDDFANWQERLNVRHMLDVQDGAIYDNLDSPCYTEE